ncbi:ATP-synt E domain containing protein [Asbolus verrucosus]|uniref:ATP synthase F(0) complex subunit e, mitochondrial n=1 Tax=Asbolus verrucosus TaxID=1661398 RepID=A0A482VSJ1_ASBVE|nr:ATP-synt E domain containing protein [Asbolus verrucosus]
MSSLPKPLPVHPLIKFARWSLLITGIFYGAYRQKRLAKKEAAFRREEIKKKEIRDKQLAPEKKLAGERELVELEEMFLHGGDSTDDF